MSAPGGARRGLIDRVVGAYWDFAGSMRRLLGERPSEATLLSFVMIAALVQIFGGVVELIVRVAPERAAEPDRLQREIAEIFIAWAFVAPIGLYVMSAIATPILRRFGGEGGYYETRAAFAWFSAVAAAPLLLAKFATALGFALARSLEAPALTGVGFFAETLFLALAIYIWGGCVAAAHNFRSPARVLGVASIFVILLLGAAYLALQGLRG